MTICSDPLTSNPPAHEKGAKRPLKWRQSKILVRGLDDVERCEGWNGAARLKFQTFNPNPKKTLFLQGRPIL